MSQREREDRYAELQLQLRHGVTEQELREAELSNARKSLVLAYMDTGYRLNNIRRFINDYRVSVNAGGPTAPDNVIPAYESIQRIVHDGSLEYRILELEQEARALAEGQLASMRHYLARVQSADLAARQPPQRPSQQPPAAAARQSPQRQQPPQQPPAASRQSPQQPQGQQLPAANDGRGMTGYLGQALPFIQSSAEAGFKYALTPYIGSEGVAALEAFIKGYENKGQGTMSRQIQELNDRTDHLADSLGQYNTRIGRLENDIDTLNTHLGISAGGGGKKRKNAKRKSHKRKSHKRKKTKMKYKKKSKSIK